MITSAIVLSKISMTKSFKSRCLCYWRVDSPYLENCLKHNQKLHNTKISFWRNSWDFQAWESRQENKIFPLMWILHSAIVWVNNPFWKYIYWQNMRLGIEKKVLKKLQDLPETFQNYFSRIFQMDQWLFVSNGNKRISSTRKSRKIILFYLYVYKHFFSLKMFSSYITPVYYCEDQFSILNHTIPLLWRKWVSINVFVKHFKVTFFWFP